MTNLGLILSTLYPNAAQGDYLVQDNSDGNGPYIAQWDEAKLGPQPDAATLQATDVVKIQHNGGLDRQIKVIESRELLPRAAREAILVGIAKDYMRDNSVTFPQAVAALTTAGGPGYNAGFTKLYALDNQIKALRQQRQP